MALRLRLKADERVIIGGAVIRNGGSRAELVIENTVPVLREADILSPGAVVTPCQRIYLALQLMYVDPARLARHQATFEVLASEVAEAAPSCRPLIRRITTRVVRQQYYQAIKLAGQLVAHEKELLARVS